MNHSCGGKNAITKCRISLVNFLISSNEKARESPLHHGLFCQYLHYQVQQLYCYCWDNSLSPTYPEVALITLLLLDNKLLENKKTKSH